MRNPIDGAIRHIAKFKFNPITLFEYKQIVKLLNSKKPLGPSNVPAWTLKDCLNIISEPLTYLIKAFLDEEDFRFIFREHMLYQYTKRVTPKNETIIDQSQSHRQYQKFLKR